MSVAVSRKSRSYMCSIGSYSGGSLSGGMQFLGGMRPISTGRAPSVYGGAGGYDTRISQYGFSTSSNIAVCGNEKSTMQNLNDRLGSYLEKVRTLEEANRKLELNIKEFYEKRAPYSKDMTVYFSTISDLRVQLLRKSEEYHRVILQVDNSRLAADDYKMKYEMELSGRMVVEADLARLRVLLDSLTQARPNMEVQIEGLKDELVFIKQNHEEEMSLVRAEQSGAVNVEMECAESTDLNKVLMEMREQYESMVQKNQRQAEKWFQDKLDVLQIQITTSTTEVKTHWSELTELKRTQQSLEIELQAQLSQKQYLEQNAEDVNARYNVQLSERQLRINTLEAELRQLTISIQQQSADYKMLLDIKMRLELEIAEYRRLLDGEAHRVKVVEVKVEEVKEEYKPHIERRVKTIVEQIVDGIVVSSTLDTQVEDIQRASREVKYV